MASGMYAGQAAADALARGDTSREALQGYRQRLTDSFVLRDHRKLRRVPSLVLSDRVQQQYPAFVTGIVERMFQVDNPRPKPGLNRIVLQERRKAGVRWRDLALDAWNGLRSFG
jgi:electron transfer flavoprotein-quinone oxidoreductase